MLKRVALLATMVLGASAQINVLANEISSAWSDAVAAGLHFPRLAARHRRLESFFLHRSGWSSLVRLCLSANGVDRSVHLDGAHHGG